MNNPWWRTQRALFAAGFLLCTGLMLTALYLQHSLDLEPCPLCAAALSAARIARIYYGAPDPKSGGIEQGPRIFTHPQAHHKPQVFGGIEEAACAAVLRAFFGHRRG